MRCHEIRYEEISVTKLELRLYLEVKSVLLPSRPGQNTQICRGTTPVKTPLLCPAIVCSQQCCWTRQPGGQPTSRPGLAMRAARILVMRTAYEMRIAVLFKSNDQPAIRPRPPQGSRSCEQKWCHTSIQPCLLLVQESLDAKIYR